jgi:hypothetical protein
MMLHQIPLAELATYAALLTSEQAIMLRGQAFLADSYFNPIDDAHGNWIISAEEVAYCANPAFLWVKELPMIPYNPKPSPPMPGMTEQTELLP